MKCRTFAEASKRVVVLALGCRRCAIEGVVPAQVGIRVIVGAPTTHSFKEYDATTRLYTY